MRKSIAGVFVALIPSLALAHVTLEPRTAPAGEYAKLTFRVPHGCDSSATRKLTVQLPEGSVSVKPQVHPGWKITTKKVKLAQPLTLPGKVITETISEVSWQGGPLEDQYMDEFGISLKLPNQAGEVLVPVIQDCQKGTVRWVEAARKEDGATKPQFPAPVLTLTTTSPVHSGH